MSPTSSETTPEIAVETAAAGVSAPRSAENAAIAAITAESAPAARAGFIAVAPLEAVRRQGVVVVRDAAADRPIAVFAHDTGDGISAVDNRCPHMGFPLSRGTVRDGILTCHWHQARFDLCSGCTFDLFADDVPAYEVDVRDGWVFVAVHPRARDAAQRFRRRLNEGMEQNVALIQAKGIIGLLREGVDYRDIVQQIARFGARNRDGWSAGMTTLTALANLIPLLGEEAAYLALYQGAVRVSDDCAGQPPRRERPPLETNAVPLETLKRWLLHWVQSRHRDGAERTLRTAIATGATPTELRDLLFTAATERAYADGGHVLDFCNKATEALDLIGWEYAAEILPSVLGQLVSARGGEEMSHWRYPIDVLPALEAAARDLPELLRASAAAAEDAGKAWEDATRTPALATALLGDDSLAIVTALRDALHDGARPAHLSKALAYAAALRVARFGPANERGDWITVLHTFTYCNAVHQAVKRCPTPEVTRGVFHGAMAVYFDRFLNVPPARLPGEQRAGDGNEVEPERDGATLLAAFLTALDGQQRVQSAAWSVASYLRRDSPLPPLYDALTRAAVREDANFHTLQMLEAGIAQYREWEDQPETAAPILIAVARYLAAHAPTPRARLQTAQIALRLHRGDSLYEEDEAHRSDEDD